MMHYPIATALTASVFGLVYFVLTMRVGLARRESGVTLGDGGNAALQRQVRVHANFAEFVPICLILLGLIESLGADMLLVMSVALVFLAARILHAVGLSRDSGATFGRIMGAFGTIFVLAGSSIWLGMMALDHFMA